MSERIVIDANGNKHITSEPLLHKQKQRPWVYLTDEERRGLWRVIIGWGDPSHDDEDLMKAIEDAVRRKNAA